MKFRALKTFYSEETKSGYVEGFFYTVRPGNDLLKGLVDEWLEEGVVEVIYADPDKGKVGGSGIVR